MFKRIDFESGVIPVGEKKLIIQSTISVDKWIPYEKIQATFSFGKDIEAVEKDLSIAFDLLNKQKPADAAVLISNLRLNIVKNLEDRIPTALELCFLFLTYEDEDGSVYKPELNKQKLDDIRKEGYVMEDFFTLASNLARGFIPAFEKISQDISEAVARLDSSITDK